MNEESAIIVLGAGPAGLTAARALSRAGKKVIVLEKESSVGGISSSRRWNGFITEYGPHTYHLKHDRIDRVIREHYPAALPAKKRITRMLIRGKYFDYPLKFWQLLRGLNPFFSARMLGDFIYASLKNRLFPRPDNSFAAWGIRRFGKTLYDLCFGQYTERVWGVPASRLSTRLASQKLHRLNLKDILIKLLGGKGEEQATYWEDFLYPEEGMGIIFKNMASRIRHDGGEVWLQSEAVSSSLESDRLVTVTVNKEGEEITVPCSAVISTIPLYSLGKLISDYLSPSALEASRELKNRSLILVNLILNVPLVSDAHWVYLLDPFFRFNRFCEQKNLLLEKKPRLKTLITFEICCDFKDSLWEKSESELLALVRRDIENIKLIDGRRINDCSVGRVKNAYPIYDLGFENRLQRLLTSLSGIKNLYSSGRQGLFLNTDMHDSMEMGARAAEAALKGEESRSWYSGMIPYLDFKTGGTNR